MTAKENFPRVLHLDLGTSAFERMSIAAHKSRLSSLVEVDNAAESSEEECVYLEEWQAATTAKPTTPQTTPPTTPPTATLGECRFDHNGYSLKADIAFLLDEDHEISNNHFHQLTELMKHILEPFKVGSDFLNVAGE